MLPKTILKKMAVELRSKTDDQLKDLLNLCNNQLLMLNVDENFSTKVKQKIELIKQEMYLRETVNSIQN